MSQDGIGPIMLCVENVPGASVIEIKTNLSVNARVDMPPLSIGVIVKGGDDQTVAEAILSRLPPYIETVGDIEIWCDVRGHSRHVRFSRPEPS